MYKIILFVATGFVLTCAMGIPGDGASGIINSSSGIEKQYFYFERYSLVPVSTKYQNHYSYNYSSSAKQEWKCVNNVCEEIVTRCKNGVCETKKKDQIDAQVFKPEILQLEPPPFDVKNFDSSVQQSWRCVNNNCEETVTTCKSGLCTTKTTPFNGENFRPEMQNIIPSGATTVDNTAPVDSVIDYKNFVWNNSKQITKKCQNSLCTTITKSCTNGACQEKTVIDKI